MVTHPVASTARLIENIVIESYESDYMALRGAYTVLSRLISVTVFPAFLAIETLFACPLKIILSIGTDQFGKSIDNMVKCALSFFATPLNLYAPEGVTGFFLRCDEPNAVRPFGVEKIFGREVDEVKFPTTVVELKAIVAEAKADNKQISIIGAGFSQGTQTVPKDDKHIVINMQKFHEMQLSDDDTTVTVGSGATWEMLQDLLNTCGKSTIVKQASDPFSIGGSIGINCHGWAHDAGSIASTVTEMQIIDAEGNYKTLTPSDEQFGCMFGTLGYFGIIVNVTFKIVPNEYLIESTEEVSIDECAENYEREIKDHENIPLFGGRLKLDQTSGNPLTGRVCMVRYTRDQDQSVEMTVEGQEAFRLEPETGTRFERIALKLISHLPDFLVHKMLGWFWGQERMAMLNGRRMTRNEALHPAINAFKALHPSNLHAQWLQEYFITKERLPNFLRYLGAELKANKVRLINATIRPTPKDKISILPYAEQDRYAVVLCFAQLKTKRAMEKTRKWIEAVNSYILRTGDVYYQAYMPYTSREQFEQAYGKERVAKMRELKKQYDPQNIFGNGHTAKYFDAPQEEIQCQQQ